MEIGKELVLIDFDCKGHVVRFYLGEPGVEPWGDDWNDTPYEHNAGEVYTEFVAGYVDVAFDFDVIVTEPCDGYLNSPWCKEDMLKRYVPCLATMVLEDPYDKWRYEEFSNVIANDAAKKFFFYDKVIYGDASFLPEYATVLSWHDGFPTFN